MKIYINDIPVVILPKAEIGEWDKFDTIKKGSNKMFSQLDLKGNILFVDLNPTDVKIFLVLFQDKKFSKAKSVTFAVNNYKKGKKLIKQQFSIIKAAGGVAIKDDKMLMIYRYKRWDLPKGKMDKGEKTKTTAIREVEEECNVKLELKDKIVVTWHTYMKNEKRILKKTSWYLMQCIDDSKMTPQLEEGIEKCEWCTSANVGDKLKKSFPSIAEVFRNLNTKFNYDIKIPMKRIGGTDHYI
jgi:8-oxo-dGTP pyrophosphatase MutT (NUDIX family)